MNYHEMTISKFHKALENQETTVTDLVNFYLKQIEMKDSELHAVIMVNPDVVQEAEELDAFYRDNGLIGPLHGVPVLVKDNVETKGMETTAGSISLKGFIPEKDAPIVESLKKAGAIVIAKANLHEFAIWGETISSVLGQTVNPYDSTRTPGGSSGGTGAGIAADYAIIGIGTDTINSVRSPSSANNLVGIRPTIGVVSRTGIVPYSLTQDTAGPIARTVEDAVKCLEYMKGYDSEDDSTAWNYENQGQSYVSHLIKDGLKGKRIGVLKDLFGTDPVHEDTTRAVEAAVERLKEGGADLIELKESFDTGALVKNVSVHLHDFKDHLNKYLETLPASMPYRTMEAIVESGKHHPGVKENMETALKLTTDSDAYRQRLTRRTDLQNRVMKLMADYDLDALVYPHQKQLVCKIGDSQNERNGVIASVTGFPSICVPAGFSSPKETAPIGVPIGMEIMGRPFSEGKLIEIAYAYEQVANVRIAPQK